MTEEFYSTKEILINNGKILLVSLLLCAFTIFFFVLSAYEHGPISYILFLIFLAWFVYYTDTRISNGKAALIFVAITTLLFLIDKLIINIPLVDKYIYYLLK